MTLAMPKLTTSDAANAEALVERYGDRIRYVPRWGRWLAWDGSVWREDHGAVRVTELARALFGKARDISAAIHLARGIDGIPIEHEALDADPWLLGVANGVMDLRTGEHRPARPEDLMTRQAPTRWEARATCPRWLQCLEEWHPDEATRDYIQRASGAALIGRQRDHVLVIHFGGGGNGKGTFARAHQATLGPTYCIVPHMSLLVQQRHQEHDTQRAYLFRARLAIASETSARRRLDEANVKNLTGADRIQARRMREDPWEFEPSHSLWLQTNYLPAVTGRDTGIWRRIRVVPWVATFLGERAAEDLDAVLADEAPGILRWMVEGCLAYQERGLDEPEAVIRASLEYRQAEDVYSRLQRDLGILFGPGLQVGADDLHLAVEDWGRAQGVEVKTRDLATWLREHGATSKRLRACAGKRPTVWVGVGIADAEHDPLDDVDDQVDHPDHPSPVIGPPRARMRGKPPVTDPGDPPSLEPCPGCPNLVRGGGYCGPCRETMGAL